jgi:ubiquinone/menaquinone biosynthesis C-methylase UbiE
MDRVLEPELMDDPAQAVAYARADFADVNRGFVERFMAAFPELTRGHVLDLGCGPADIPIRLLRARPQLRITAVDGSAAMLGLARDALRRDRPPGQIDLVRGLVPGLPFADASFDAVVSNSLLHHLAEPEPFWRELRRLVRTGAPILVMDLFRPASKQAARAIVEAAAASEPEILKRDFYNSLLAAFTIDEVRQQLRAVLPHLSCEIASERHWVAWGRATPPTLYLVS